jgi:hypothetical protein
MERRIVQVIGPRPLPAKKLDALAGCRPCQRFRRALWLLRDAGVVNCGKRGWRLTEMIEVAEV